MCGAEYQLSPNLASISISSTRIFNAFFACKGLRQLVLDISHGDVRVSGCQHIANVELRGHVYASRNVCIDFGNATVNSLSYSSFDEYEGIFIMYF